MENRQCSQARPLICLYLDKLLILHAPSVLSLFICFVINTNSKADWLAAKESCRPQPDPDRRPKKMTQKVPLIQSGENPSGRDLRGASEAGQPQQR